MSRALLALCLLAACGRAPATDSRDEAAYDRYRRPDLLLAALELRPGLRVADVGAGRGYLTGRLADAVAPDGPVVALDVDEAALTALRARLPSPRVSTRLVGADDPELEPGAYDLALVAEVDHLFADRADYLVRLRRALAPGGRIAVTNRLVYRAPLVEAAARAGLEPRRETHDLPGHFLILLEVKR